MIIVTGGAGFIGSRLIQALNARHRTDIIVVDNLRNGKKFTNLVDCQIADYLDKEEFLDIVQRDQEIDGFIEVVFHQGACSSTTEWDGHYMMKNNFSYSKALLHYCQDRAIPLIYASSAAVYGSHCVFKEEPVYEKPLNIYGYAKMQFDCYVRNYLPRAKSQLVGLRYFNVYGFGEQHKGQMASVIFHWYQQLKNGAATIKLFGGCDGYADGEQRRDFIAVEDVVDINLWCWEHETSSGIFNVGTGISRTFNEVARAVIAWFGHGAIEYIPFPQHLQGNYQSFTQADINRLRQAGYRKSFTTLEQAVRTYLNDLSKQAF